MNFNIDIIIVAIYLFISLVVGIWKGRNIKSMKEYAVADRNYPVPILVATIAATWYGGDSTIGVVEIIYSFGIVIVVFGMVNALPNLFIANYIAPRMKNFTNAISAGDIMESLYGKAAKFITGVAGLGLSMGYIGAQIAALGYVLNSFFGIDTTLGIYISAGVVIIYSAFGGIKSVTATDVIQFGAIVIVIPLMAVTALQKVGGINYLLTNIEPSKLSFFPPSISAFDVLFSLTIMLIPFLNPAIIQRLLLASNSNNLARSFKIAATLDIIFYLLVGIIGLCAYMLNSGLEAGEAYFYIINETLPVGIRGLAIVGILAVIMSTADSYLNAASISLVHDIITPFRKNISTKATLNLSKIVSVIIGLGGIWMATAHNSVIDIVHAALDFWGPIVVAPLILGIIGFKASSRTFFISATIAIIFYFILKTTTSTNAFGVSTALLPSMLVNASVFLLLYYFIDRRKYNNDGGHTPKGKKNNGENIKNNNDVSENNSVEQNIKAKNKTLFSNSLYKIATERVNLYGAQYVAMGVFGLVNYYIHSFIFSDALQDSNSFSAIRVLVPSFYFILILKDFWPTKLKKYLPIYWYFTLLYCLPFYTSLSIFSDGLTIPHLLNICLGIFLLAVLTDWLSFSILLILGILASSIYYFILLDNSLSIASNESLFVLLYTLAISIAISLVFFRTREAMHKEVIKVKNILNNNLEELVEEKTKHLKEALEVKKSFLNNMSHEIKTPLQGILGISHELKFAWKKTSDKDRKFFVDKIVSNCDRLMNLLSNLLDVSKMESNKMGFNMDMHNIVNVSKEVLEEYKISIYKSKLDLKVKTKQNLLLSFDDERIRQVLRNLISNAIKFGNNKKIDLVIEEATYSVLNNKNLLGIKVSVIDRGIGVPKDELEHIFYPFEESSRTKSKAGGTGLGLAICKEIIEAHKGIIAAESEHDKTTFFFILPLLVKNLNSSKPKKKLTILLVDDEDACLTACSLIITSLGHKVITAPGGIEALKILNKHKNIDIVLLDLMMPDIYGINVLKDIKSFGKLSDIPVIMQSGISDQSEIKRAYNHGAANFITKPYLKNSVKEALSPWS